MNKGTFYGVGVGPGDPKLMTLKAMEIIELCPVVAAPRTSNGGTAALDIVKGAMDLSGKTVLLLEFGMHRHAKDYDVTHARAAEALRVHLDRGESVAMLNLGDISIYASYRYLADILGPEGYPLEMIPGVTSFCAAASRLGVTLTDMGTVVSIVPDSDGDDEEFLARPGTSIFMKSGRKLPALLRRIRERGLAANAMLVQNCGMRDERVIPTLGDEDPDPRYFTVVIVKTGGSAQ